MVIGRVPKPYRPCQPRYQRRPNYTRASSTPINCNASTPLPSGSEDPLAQSSGTASRAGNEEAKARSVLDNGVPCDRKGIEAGWEVKHVYVIVTDSGF